RFKKFEYYSFQDEDIRTFHHCITLVTTHSMNFQENCGIMNFSYILHYLYRTR
ncbi:hypothetical protein L9F63_012190, partial [Diploptera punctata]